MKRVKLNALIDIFSLIFFLVSLISGIVLWIVLPSGGGFQGINRRGWINIHIISSLVFAILVICHHILHWNWFKNLAKIIRG